jgi:hypothetical protein
MQIYQNTQKYDSVTIIQYGLYYLINWFWKGYIDVIFTTSYLMFKDIRRSHFITNGLNKTNITKL